MSNISAQWSADKPTFIAAFPATEFAAQSTAISTAEFAAIQTAYERTHFATISRTELPPIRSAI